MSQRFYLAIFIILTVFYSCESAPESNRVEEKESPGGALRKPNIVFILADDLGYGDLGITGQKQFETPNIDKLASQGILFSQHYAGAPICASSRSSLMSGKHTGHTLVRGNMEIQPEGQFPMDSSVTIIPELLKSAGYVTGAFGKWGMGYPGSHSTPNKRGFDEFFGYNCQRFAHNYYPLHLWKNDKKIMLAENEGTAQGTYAPSLIHKEALKFIEDNKDTSFFLYYPSIIPHAELFAPEENMKKYRGEITEGKGYDGIDSGYYYKNGGYGSQKEPHAAFAAMIDLLDIQVGEIRKKLEDLGIADNTLIVFTSDNGAHREGGADPDFFNSTGGLRGYKRDLYEGGIRVPMIAYWPGKIKKPKRSDHISAFWDFLPTFCELADVSVPANTDGISILPELLGKEQKKHAHLYWEFPLGIGLQAVRMGKWKGVRLNVDEQPNTTPEIYDLSLDIAEKNNLATEYPEIADKIGEIMKKEHKYSPVFYFKYEMEEMTEGGK